MKRALPLLMLMFGSGLDVDMCLLGTQCFNLESIFLQRLPYSQYSLLQLK